MKIRVSVIIPTFKDNDRLSLCLDSLVNQSYHESGFEIIVINNDPNCDIPKRLTEKYNKVIFLNENIKGSYAARNKGVVNSKGEILFFTDSDCIVEQNWINNGVALLDQEPNCVRIGGKVELFYKGASPRSLGEIYESCYAFRQREYIEKQAMAVTANMITYRWLFDKVGLFNAGLLSGGDCEWGRRANDLGFGVKYSEELLVKHPARYSIKEIVIKNRREAGGKFIVNECSKLTVINFLKGVLPPLKSIFYMNKVGPKWHYFIAFTIRYFLRIDSLIEKVKIGVLNKDAERN
ncbi:glycosyltransferase [Shewanella sp. 125m-1]